MVNIQTHLYLYVQAWTTKIIGPCRSYLDFLGGEASAGPA
ncbi:hypothetical protein PRJ_5057 [Pseudomonas sp. XWY-1]|nr:hypothetical protein PRJ_5057 [Pseudomonas sp. XWY-1]